MGLKTDTLEALVKKTAIKSARSFYWIGIIVLFLAIGMVYFDISYNENSLDKVALELQSDAEKMGIKGNIGVSFKREVSKGLKKGY